MTTSLGILNNPHVDYENKNKALFDLNAFLAFSGLVLIEHVVLL